MATTTGSPIQAADAIGVNLPSFLRSLRAQAKSPKTIETYREAVVQFEGHLRTKGMPLELPAIRREHVEDFIEALQARWQPATVNNRYRGLQAFFKWTTDEEIVEISPMAKMKPPKVPEVLVPVLSESELKRVIGLVEKGKSFEDRRDTAILRVFAATGLRLAELADLRLTPGDDETNDVDLDDGLLRVFRGKGGRQRMVAVGSKAAQALDRYVRLRSVHPDSALQWLWLSRKGRFTESGIAQMVTRRGAEAGVAIHPHQFRHTWAHGLMSKGMSNQDLRVAGGWRSDAMLSRYAAASAQDRSLAAQRRLNPGDDV